jgi:hypothetical protein
LVQSSALAKLVRLLDSNLTTDQIKAAIALGILAGKDIINRKVAYAGAIAKLVRLLILPCTEVQERAVLHWPNCAQVEK